MKLVIIFLVFAILPGIVKAQNVESETSVNKSKTFVEAMAGVHNSAGGGGIGVGYGLSDRVAIGIRWFAGNMDEEKTFDNFDRTRIAFISADGHSEELSIVAKFLVWDTLTISTAIGQRRYSSILDIHDKQNILRAGEVRADSTVTDAYLGIGNYWTGSWYRIGADWIGFSVPLSSKVDAVYTYTEPTDSGMTFREDNPGYYYSNVTSLLRQAKDAAVQTSYTFLLGNFTVLF